MPGHLEKRSEKSWTIVIEAGRDPATGKRKRIKRAFQGTKREAEKEMARLIAEIEKGSYIEPSKLTFGEYLQEWLLDYGANNLSPTTRRRYGQIINLRVIPKLGMIPLQKLRPIHLQQFLREIIEEGRLDKPGEPLSADSIAYHHRVIHKALDTAFKQQLIQVNPADAVEVPKAPALEIEDEDGYEEKVQVLTSDEVDKMLEAAVETPYYTLLFVAVRTGLRRGELLGLRWKDIDFRARTLSVKQTLAYTPEKGLFFKPPKSKKSRRMIDISGEVVEVLKQHKKKQAEAKLFFGQEYQDNGLVFCQDNGRPMHPDTPSSWFPEFLERIGLPRLNFHCLRHTHASLLLQAGVDIKIISERLGHSSIRITYDIYSHLMPGMQRDAVDRLESLLRK
jgi:integrase